MEDELKKTKERLEKVFTKLSNCLDEDLETTGIVGLGQVLDNIGKTVELLGKLEKLLNQGL